MVCGIYNGILLSHKKRKTPQNHKSPTYRQMFITTIKNVTEKKKAQKLNWISSANKIDNYNRGGQKGGKFQKILQNKSKNKKNKCFS